MLEPTRAGIRPDHGRREHLIYDLLRHSVVLLLNQRQIPDEGPEYTPSN
jgi:hypothetical protein